MTEIERIQIQARWPEYIPDVAEDFHGWLSQPTQLLLKECLSETTPLVIELGSWLGKSTRFILENAPRSRVIAIDHWKGSAEHLADPNLYEKLPYLYETFIRNCWSYRDRLIPIRRPSIEGLRLIEGFNLKPDLIYLDASHDFESVLSDLTEIHRIYPQSIILGDDWWLESVRSATFEFLKDHRYELKKNSMAFQLSPH